MVSMGIALCEGEAMKSGRMLTEKRALERWRIRPELAEIVLATVIVLMAWTGATAQEVYVNSSPGANFSNYHTYAWGQQANANQIANSFLAQEAQRQVNQQLQSKGLTMVQESENPDLIVVGNGGMKAQTSYNMWGTRMIGGGTGTITPETTLEGALIVDLYDAKAKELVWRGVAQNAVNEKNAQKNMKIVDKAIEKMFKKYPPH
jgi:hypothetical protein